MQQSDNPSLSKSVLERISAVEDTKTATITGTSLKILFLLTLTVGAGYFGWQSMANATSSAFITIAGFSIVALIAAIVTVFKPTWAMITGPIYALAQGFVLGAVSQTYNAQFNGIVVQAIGLTGAIFFVSLWAFWLGLIKVTNKFRIGVVIATLGVGLYYLIAFILSLFGVTAPLIFDTGTFGIVFSVVVVFIATLNLFLDFDFIQQAEARKMPKVFEWYGAFALMVTLIWLYIETLRLIGKTRS